MKQRLMKQWLNACGATPVKHDMGYLLLGDMYTLHVGFSKTVGERGLQSIVIRTKPSKDPVGRFRGGQGGAGGKGGAQWRGGVPCCGSCF